MVTKSEFTRQIVEGDAKPNWAKISEVLEIIERDVLPSLFVGVLAKDDKWLEHSLNETLTLLVERALRLAQDCMNSGEGAQDDPLVDEKRIRTMFKDTRLKLEKEHLTREFVRNYRNMS